MAVQENAGNFGRKFEEKGKSETIIRQRDSLIGAFGEDVMKAFMDKVTTEIYRNADGRVWQDRLGEPKVCLGTMDAMTAMNAIRICAGASNLIINEKSPRLDTEFFFDGSRFAAAVPPACDGPTFNIRKKALMVFSLNEYVDGGIMSQEQCDRIIQAITDHKNILLIGGTGTGKTTLANAIIAEIVRQYPEERLVIIEDTKELQCTAEDYVQFHTVPLAEPPITMTDLVRHSLRVKPKRIIVGEIRGGEGLDLLDAWNTGHEGGIVTLHSNTAMTGLTRLKSLVSRHPKAPKEGIETLIGEVAHMVVHIGMVGHGRRVKEILEIEGWDDVARRYVIKGAVQGLNPEKERNALRRLVRRFWLKLRSVGHVDESSEDEVRLLGLDDMDDVA